MNKWSNNYYNLQQDNTKDNTPRLQQPAPITTTPHHSTSNNTPNNNNGVVNLCVYRVAHLTNLTLKSLIERQGVQVLRTEQISHKVAGYKSFVVTVKEKDASKLLNKSFWPGLVSCRLLQDGGQWQKDVFSRRYTRELSLPSSIREGISFYHRQRDSRGGEPWPGDMVMDKAKTVHSVTSQNTHVTNNMQTKAKIKVISNPTERDDSNESINPQKEIIPTNTTKREAEKPKILKAKGITALPGTDSIQTKRRNSDEATPKAAANTASEKTQPITQRTTRTRIADLKNYSIGRNKRHKLGTTLTRKSSAREAITDIKRISNGKRQSDIFTHAHRYTVSKPKSTQSNWILPLKELLNMSSEEALIRLLNPLFDRLLTQYNVTDEEIFLGVKVLAHCVRAEGHPYKVQELVYKICRPQVVFLVKQFTRTIEEKHIMKAEEYFWDLGEFLDQYIVHNLFIHGMLSLFATCLSKILALNHGKYVSNDLLKVFRGMQTKVFANLP